MNIVIGAMGGGAAGATSAVTKESLSWAADQMRQAMIEDAKKFPGICDAQGNCLTNLSGQSAGVNGDNVKGAGGRVDLSKLCADKRCTEDISTASGYVEDLNGKVKMNLVDKDNNPVNLADIIISDLNNWRSPMGGWQGGTGKFAFFDYAPGSVWDKVAEAYAGTHDTFNKPTWYDNQGNIKADIEQTLVGKVGNITNYTNVILATPFALSVLLPPEVWNAVLIGLGGKP